MDTATGLSIGAILIALASLLLSRRSENLNCHREVVALQSSLRRSIQQLRAGLAAQQTTIATLAMHIQQSLGSLPEPDATASDVPAKIQNLSERISALSAHCEVCQRELENAYDELGEIEATVEAIVPSKSTSANKVMKLREYAANVDRLRASNIATQDALNDTLAALERPPPAINATKFRDNSN